MSSGMKKTLTCVGYVHKCCRTDCANISAPPHATIGKNAHFGLQKRSAQEAHHPPSLAQSSL